MTDPVTLTLVRYPPRDLADRRGRRGARGIAAASACLLWLPAGYHAATSALGGIGWTGDADAWLLLAGLAVGGVPLALACRLLWRRGRAWAACAAFAVLGPGAVAGTLALEGFGPFAVAAAAVSASLPAWFMWAGRPRARRLGV